MEPLHCPSYKVRPVAFVVMQVPSTGEYAKRPQCCECGEQLEMRNVLEGKLRMPDRTIPVWYLYPNKSD